MLASREIQESSPESSRALWFGKGVWREWVTRCGWVAFSFGLLLGLVNAASVHWLEAFASNTRALGGLSLAGGLWPGLWLTSACYGIAGWTYGAATGALTTSRGGRFACGLGLSLLLSLALLLNLASVVLCLYSGSYLTYGALQFTLNSWGHLVDAAVSGHATSLAVVIVLSLCTAVALVFLLGRRPRPRLARWPSTVGKYACVAVPAGWVALGQPGGQLLADDTQRDQLWASTPELVLYTTWDAIASTVDPSHVSAHTRSGPPLETGRVWKATADSRHQPNVLLILLESVSTAYVGYLGADAGVTPHLDALAQESLVMRRAWSTATHSNYAQMAVLSSLLPRRGLGLDTYQRLNYPRVLLHDLFAPRGYAAATISSQDESWQGMSRFQATETPVWFADARSHKGPRVNIGSERIAPDHLTTEKALDWIAAQREPWSLYVNFQATHFPYSLAPGVERPFRPDTPKAGSFDYLRYPETEHAVVVNRYKNALSYVDEQVGRLVSGLRASGELDNTLLVVTADHGELFHDHGLVTHGRTLFEGEARVPLLVHWHGHVSPHVSDKAVSTLDVMPTILDLVGTPPHPAHQGTSFFEGNRPAEAVETPGQAVLLNIQGLRSMEGIVCWPYKLTRDVSSRQPSLFDLSTDAGETLDLALLQPERTDTLLRLLRRTMVAQDRYHAGPLTEKHYAPRLPRCPSEPLAQAKTSAMTL